MAVNVRSDSPAEFEEYLELVRAFPLRPIKDEDQLDAAISVLDSLLDRRDLTEAQQDYLDVLGSLISDFEDTQHPMPPASHTEVLRFLMDEHGLRQVDLVPMFGSKSIVSEVLRGKRQLNLGHVRRLSKHFHVPADVFIDDE